MSKEIPQYEALYARRHPEYADSVEHWDFCEETYRGGRAWFAKHLHTYVKEGEKEFAERVKRASRFNHTREAVDLVQKYLFKVLPKRDEAGAPDSVKRFWRRSTRRGFGINELMRVVSTKASIMGRVAVVVDNNLGVKIGTDVEVLSQAEVEQSGVSIYAYVVGPQNILDYAYDEDDGELLWVQLREFDRDDKDPLSATGTTRERQRIWTRNEWFLFERPDPVNGEKQDVVLVTSGTHGLGMVPVFFADYSVSDAKYVPPSLVDDIAYLDRTIANYLSNLDAIIQDQTFSQLAIPAQALTPDQTKAKDNIVEMGTKRIFTYDGGSGSTAKPEYLSPDPKQAGVILDVVSKHINEIYHTIGLAGERTKEDNSVGIDNSSGVAKAYDFERVNSLLLSRAGQCSRLENWLVKIVCAWAGENEPEEPVVTYPETFDVAGLGDELVIAEALSKIQAPAEIRKQHMLVILDKLFPQVTKERYAQLEAAVKSWNTDVVDAPKQAVGGATKSSGKVAAPNRQGSVTADTQKK